MRQSIDDMLCDDNLTKEVLACMSRPLRCLPLDTEAISPNPDGSLHCVEAIREKVNNSYVLRLRVIIKNYGGSVRVTIPCADSGNEYRRFLRLRYSIRNSDVVLISFKNLRVYACDYAKLYLFAQDFTVLSDGADLEIDL